MTSRAAAIASIALVAAACAGTGVLASLVVRLAEPSRLVWLAAPAISWALFVGWRLWRERVAARLGDRATVLSMSLDRGDRLVWIQAIVLHLGLVLLSLAVARPQWGERVREVQRRGIDVVVAVDLSRSMLAEDVAPSRLDATRAEIDRLMRSLRGDRVGLVVFAADAVVQSPLTSDHGAIEHYLDRVSPDDFSRQGTAIGRAITSATELLTGRFAEGFERAGTQVIVVFSDGEDTISDPIAAAEVAREAGVRVYTVGVGTAEGARIPLRGRDGTLTAYVTDRNGQVVTSKLVGDQLARIAEIASGEYLQLGAGVDVARALQYAFEQYDAETLSSVLRAEYEDRFVFFALPGLLLLLVAFAMGSRRARPGLTHIAALALLALVAGCGELPTREDPRVRRAIDALAADSIDEARTLLDQAAAEAKVQPVWEYDRGRVEEAADALADAQDRYLRAISDADPVGQARALFGLANVLLARERWDEAIERYRRVLALDPAHAGAQRNLEIALRRRFPPCDTLDDDAEENDVAASAAQLPSQAFEGDFVPPGVAEGSGEEAAFVACPADADWFVMPAIGGSTLDIEVTFRRLREDTGGAALPDSIPPIAVRLALFGHDGVSPLAVDQGLANAEGSGAPAEVPARSLVRRLDDVLIDPALGNDSLAYLKVEVDAPTEYTYTVSIEVTPPCWALEDAFESNDLPSTAFSLQEGNHPARLCHGNADWYAFEVAPDHDLFVDVSGLSRDDGEPGALDVEWFVNDLAAPALTVRVDAETGGLPLELRAPHPEPVRAWLRVTSPGEDDQGQYALDVYDFGPCPDDDRFEDNDTRDTRAAIGTDPPPPYRHLRFCPGDPDLYEYTIPPPEEHEGSGEPPPERPFSVLATVDPGTPAELIVVDGTSRTLNARGDPVDASPSMRRATRSWSATWPARPSRATCRA